MEFTHYYGKHRRDKSSVIQNNVSYKTKVIHIRVDAELERNLVELAGQSNQDKSKVARDILWDYFLEQNTRNWKEETKDLR